MDGTHVNTMIRMLKHEVLLGFFRKIDENLPMTRATLYSSAEKLSKILLHFVSNIFRSFLLIFYYFAKIP